MEQGLFYEICGWVASIGMILGYLPQAIETIRKNGKHCYSASCRERAEKFYNKDDRFKDYIDLYENILDNSHV